MYRQESVAQGHLLGDPVARVRRAAESETHGETTEASAAEHRLEHGHLAARRRDGSRRTERADGHVVLRVGVGAGEHAVAAPTRGWRAKDDGGHGHAGLDSGGEGGSDGKGVKKRKSASVREDQGVGARPDSPWRCADTPADRQEAQEATTTRGRSGDPHPRKLFLEPIEAAESGPSGSRSEERASSEREEGEEDEAARAAVPPPAAHPPPSWTRLHILQQLF